MGLVEDLKREYGQMPTTPKRKARPVVKTVYVYSPYKYPSQRRSAPVRRARPMSYESRLRSAKAKKAYKKFMREERGEQIEAFKGGVKKVGGSLSSATKSISNRVKTSKKFSGAGLKVRSFVTGSIYK